MSLYSFSPEVRIRCAADYKGVFDGALFKVHQPHFLFLAKITEQPKSRLGIVVAKKKVRRAHERNRIKRLARESFRLNQQNIELLDIVVMPKMGIDTISNAELHEQLKFAWQKLQRLVKKHHKTAISSPQK
ncbi:ribonuclease P protein component [Acinetobacter sichuanensis]|uniref:Ribonuclease P protein component n=1 Tax=Acinetobacter sichuanensis TaxID=2136183 RepID=A0A371YKA1_9GAMM|nr:MULTISPECIES: ribonuclease P protein component [Acinetobacter]MDM1249315.1 ribonuclease P protein component [Acinetobacter sp. R933-2]MDM1765656.1 ribonuclease P protein component [Acinetobacter sp. 226-1]MDM1769248.1 ribonuclease P protein component [Acinetobacter sp. 226-4]MDQ9022936.1 ribonuclease P protein component [Acinetobacter sichuanensis]RFC81896.1 ribonuclease P protein component [Acinetobacter sichuanensis]